MRAEILHLALSERALNGLGQQSFEFHALHAVLLVLVHPTPAYKYVVKGVQVPYVRG